MGVGSVLDDVHLDSSYSAVFQIHYHYWLQSSVIVAFFLPHIEVSLLRLVVQFFFEVASQTDFRVSAISYLWHHLPCFERVAEQNSVGRYENCA